MSETSTYEVTVREGGEATDLRITDIPDNIPVGKEFTIGGVLEVSETGEALSDKTITVHYNDSEETVQTNDEGKWSLPLTGEESGTLKASAEFGGTEDYESSESDTHETIIGEVPSFFQALKSLDFDTMWKYHQKKTLALAGGAVVLLSFSSSSD